MGRLAARSAAGIEQRTVGEAECAFFAVGEEQAGDELSSQILRGEQAPSIRPSGEGMTGEQAHGLGQAVAQPGLRRLRRRRSRARGGAFATQGVRASAHTSRAGV